MKKLLSIIILLAFIGTAKSQGTDPTVEVGGVKLHLLKINNSDSVGVWLAKKAGKDSVNTALGTLWSRSGNAKTPGDFLGFTTGDTLYIRVGNAKAGIIGGNNYNNVIGEYAMTDSLGTNYISAKWVNWIGSNRDGHNRHQITRLTDANILGENSGPDADSLDNIVVLGNDNHATKNNQAILGNYNITESTLRGRIKTTSAAPTVAIGAGLTGSVSISGNSTAGQVVLNITTGTAYSAGATLITVTFPTTYETAPIVVLTAASQSALSSFGTVFVSNITTTGFTINVPTASTSVVANGYKWNYVAIQETN